MQYSNIIPAIITTLTIMVTSAFGQNSGNQTSDYRLVAHKSSQEKTSSTSNEVTVKNAVKVYVPNAFTPNGDGLNDSFGPTVRGIKDYSMIIMNRWGEKIFESDDPERRWDGTHGGELVESSGYVYRISIKTVDNENVVKQGEVMVMR